jgi:hypothetical protein
MYRGLASNGGNGYPDYHRARATNAPLHGELVSTRLRDLLNLGLSWGPSAFRVVTGAGECWGKSAGQGIIR